MGKIVILKGLPASGKSTWAKAKVEKSGGNWKRINKDDLRAMIDNGKWSKNNEKSILSVRDMLIDFYMDGETNIIIDDTNFAKVHEDVIRYSAELGGYDLIIKSFTDIKISTCIERDSKRENPVGEKVIRDMAKRYLPEKYKEEFLYVPDTTKPKAVIFDIDGTLATNDGHRGWYEWDKVGKDDYIDETWKILDHYRRNDYKVLFVSGRSDECSIETYAWIHSGLIGYTDFIGGGDIQLFMRSSEEQENGVCDTMVKRRIFDEDIRDNYNVEAVFDDRPRVVKMWREMGLFVFDVNQTGKDF